MNIATGIDIVDISEFHEQMKKGGERFLAKCFLPFECDATSVPSLAGIFAAKESVIKALSLEPGSWQDILVKKHKNGRPYVHLIHPPNNVLSSDLSISHTDSYAVAQFVALLS